MEHHKIKNEYKKEAIRLASMCLANNIPFEIAEYWDGFLVGYPSLGQDRVSDAVCHSGSYGRLCWNEHAQTITTRFDTPSGGRFTHPDKNRTITPREAARIQSFPDDFVFLGNRTSICKQIGNAVPPKLAFFLSKVIDNCIGE